jgi:hypothetical protein
MYVSFIEMVRKGVFGGVVNPFMFDLQLNKVKHFISECPHYELEGTVLAIIWTGSFISL